jgi:hypothetical protein
MLSTNTLADSARTNITLDRIYMQVANALAYFASPPVKYLKKVL